jgi:hypothetical protein
VFSRFSPIPVDPAVVATDTIEQNREKWIDEWTDILR